MMRGAALPVAIALLASPAVAFVNSDFEQGNLSGWTVQTVPCGSSSPPTVTVVGSGVAPFGCGFLGLPQSGAYSAELYSGYLVGACTHAVIEQQSVIPSNLSNLTLYFAGVFEAAHSWTGAGCTTLGNSFLRFTVDIVGGPTLYSDCFDNCTQSCSPGQIPAGCSSFLTCPTGQTSCTTCAGGGSAQWTILPWCQLSYSIANYAGMTARIRMEAWECAYSGHRSFGYLDVVDWQDLLATPTPVSTQTPRPPTPTITPTPMPGPPSVGPNPYVYGSSPDSIVLSGIPRDGEVAIYNVVGELLARLEGDPSGRATLSMNRNGYARFARGLYPYVFRGPVPRGKQYGTNLPPPGANRRPIVARGILAVR